MAGRSMPSHMYKQLNRLFRQLVGIKEAARHVKISRFAVLSLSRLLTTHHPQPPHSFRQQYRQQVAYRVAVPLDRSSTYDECIDPSRGRTNSLVPTPLSTIVLVTPIESSGKSAELYGFEIILPSAISIIRSERRAKSGS